MCGDIKQLHGAQGTCVCRGVGIAWMGRGQSEQADCSGLTHGNVACSARCHTSLTDPGVGRSAASLLSTFSSTTTTTTHEQPQDHESVASFCSGKLGQELTTQELAIAGAVRV